MTLDKKKTSPLIRLQDVGFTATTSILSNISLDIGQGKITTIIGPNGAGKTTLLKLMLGLIKPTTGTVTLTAGLKIGYMPQKIHMNPLLPLTVERFLQLASQSSNTQIHSQIDGILHQIGACHLKDRFLRVLSGGEMQRVLLARALMTEPDLLILDEPSQGIDVLGQAELYQLIANLRDQRGCGVVLVSHDLHMVMAASDEVVCLNHHVCCSGHPEMVQQSPEYLKMFQSHLQGLAVYTHHHDHRHDDACDHTHGENPSNTRERHD